MSTRRTRAHPSPGGLKSLPLDAPKKRTRKQPVRLRQTTATAAEPVVSSENTITIKNQPSPSPAPPTSRSQSPHVLDSDSQSAAVIESRSSSPPTDGKGHWTRSQTASTSPHSKHPTTQPPKRKTKASTKSTSRNSRKRPRSQRATGAPKIVGSYPEEVEVGEDQSAEENIVVQDSHIHQAVESSDAKNTSAETPVRKYARGRKSRTAQAGDMSSNVRSSERRPAQRKSTEFTSYSQQAGDTSDSDLADEERGPKRSKIDGNKYSPRNSGSPRVKAHYRQLSAAKSPLNLEAKQLSKRSENPPSLVPGSSDISSSSVHGAYPRRELPQLMSQKNSPSKHATPHTMRRIMSTPKSLADDNDRQLPTKIIGPLPKDGEQRLQLWMDTYKIKPELLTSYRRGAQAKASTDSEEDEDAADSGDEYEKLTRSVRLQKGDRRIFPRKKIPFELSETIGGESPVAKDRGKARLSTTNSICETLTISSNVSQQKHILTDPALIGFINQAISWFGDDESRKVPSAQKLAAFLDGSAAPSTPAAPPTERQIRIAAGVAAMQAEQPHEVADNTETEEQPSEAPSHIDEDEHMDIFSSESTPAENLESSEGEEVEEVETPHKAENEDEEMDIEPAEARSEEKPQGSRGWMSPWTGVSAVANIFATPLKFFGGRSQSASKATNRRVVGAATQPRKPAQRPIQSTPSRRPRAVAQTERARRYGVEEKPPIQLRGLISPSRIAEIHRKEDEMIEARRKREDEMAAARSRQRFAATVEEGDDDDDSETPTVEIKPETKPGQKRKRAYRPPRTPPRSAPGTFRVPSPSSSSDDDYSDEEPSTPTPAQPPKSVVSGKLIENRVLGPSQTQLKYDQNLINNPIASKFQQAAWQSCQSRIYRGAVVDLLNPKEDPVIRLLRSDRFHQWTGKGKRSGPIDRQVAVQEKISHEKWIEDHNFLMECQKKHDFCGRCIPVPRFYLHVDGRIYERFILPRHEVEEIHTILSSDPLMARDLSIKSIPLQTDLHDSNNISHRNKLAPTELTPVYDPTFGTEERARPYTGTLFAQPKSIQANINDGKFPLSPRSDVDETSTAAPAIHNIPSTQVLQNIFEAERLTKDNIEKLNESNALTKENASPAKPMVFKAPSDSSSDSDEDEEDVNEQPSTSALQTKKWTQSPPPKPRPSNASLPKMPSVAETSPVKTSDHLTSQQQNGDLARVRGAAEKFKPKQPSRLREVVQMSPNQVQEQENKFIALAREIESTAIKFDPAVMAALNAIPEADLHDIMIPFDYNQQVMDPLVEREVRMLAI
ncbi:hypothetical protein B7463_g10640, partial [Scytalidium lignicola]